MKVKLLLNLVTLISILKVYLQQRLTIDSSTGEIFLLEGLNSGYYEANAVAKITIDSEDLQSTTLVIKSFIIFLNKKEINCRYNSQ